MGYKRSHNVAHLMVTVQGAVGVAEISLLICEQMEKADSCSRPRDRCPPSAPRNLGGTQPYDIPRSTRLV